MTANKHNRIREQKKEYRKDEWERKIKRSEKLQKLRDTIYKQSQEKK
jgi:hypothetical protein